MNRININNLFPSSTTSITGNSYKPLDINSLFHPEEQRFDSKVNFSIEKLINVREEKKNKIRKKYKKIFTLCLNKITVVNNLNKTDIIYDIPDAIFRCPDYNQLDCMDFLQSRLRRLYMDTLTLSNRSIFISWLNIEDNRNMGEK